MSATVPFSDASERAVLSGILHDPAARMDMVQEQVPDGGFYHAANAAVFEVLLDLRRSCKPIDPVTLVTRAAEMEKMAVIGGESTINELYAHRPPAHHFASYLRSLQEYRGRREIIRVCNEAQERAYDLSSNPAEDLDLFQKEALTISLDADERGPIHIKPVLDEEDRLLKAKLADLSNNNQIAGFPFGLPRLDHLMQGLEDEDRFIIAALSNVGKTGLLVEIAFSFIKQGLPGLIFMLDGSAGSFIRRLWARVSGVSQHAIKTGYGLSKGGETSRAKLEEARLWLEQQGIYIDDRAGLSIQQINATTRRYAKTKGIRWNAIDFFQNGTVPGFTARELTPMLTAFSRAWKAGVLDMKKIGRPVPSILLAQVVDEVGEGEIPPCAPSIIKHCRAAFEDATKVCALSRELREMSVLKEKEFRIPDLDRNAAPPLMEGEQLIVATTAKTKDGALGNVWLRLSGETWTWRDFNPGSRLADSRVNSAARFKRHEEQGGPPPVAPPKPRIGAGPSMHGPLKITRPDRPPQKGEYMQAPKEDEP